MLTTIKHDPLSETIEKKGQKSYELKLLISLKKKLMVNEKLQNREQKQKSLPSSFDGSFFKVEQRSERKEACT